MSRTLHPLLPRGHFFGSLLSSMDSGGLTLTEYAYPPRLGVARHEHELAYFCIVLRGGYVETSGPHTRRCSPSTITFHPAGECHADRFGPEGGHIFSVELDSAWIARAGELGPIYQGPLELRGGPVEPLVYRMIREFREPDRLTPLVIESLVVEVTAEAYRFAERVRSGKRPLWLNRARELVHERYAEPLSLRDIAREVGVHPVHLAREFRRYHGATVGEYLRGLRLSTARQELASSEAPFSEIALNAGFSDQSHFSRTFRRAYGMTPTAYRSIFASR